jgi:hypothetical protein
MKSWVRREFDLAKRIAFVILKVLLILLLGAGIVALTDSKRIGVFSVWFLLVLTSNIEVVLRARRAGYRPARAERLKIAGASLALLVLGYLHARFGFE